MMAKIAAFTLVFILSFTVLLPGQTQDLVDVHGAIVVVNERNGWYGIVPDNDRGTRYAPDRLPDEFRKDGVRVIFSGRVGQTDPGVRTWGVPLILSKISFEAAP